MESLSVDILRDFTIGPEDEPWHMEVIVTGLERLGAPLIWVNGGKACACKPQSCGMQIAPRSCNNAVLHFH